MNAQAKKPRVRYPTDAKIRALAPTLVSVARELGLDVGGIEVSPDGSIRVIESRAAPAAPTNAFDKYQDEL
ncbi:hypothetical protein HZY97_20365 [Sphingomonas sp. R-74633]|uniref:hypothetical protein n=1 Tax=Sphingomonas sp. R-74633 TaxID=2751188 RepID=UPI0015D26272|nr:hypothetical protein [Sphingomonas sp. R-74633]NYT43141.1 hypothetical protein [Sphingomonas sp. R-74633]